MVTDDGIKAKAVKVPKVASSSWCETANYRSLFRETHRRGRRAGSRFPWQSSHGQRIYAKESSHLKYKCSQGLLVAQAGSCYISTIYFRSEASRLRFPVDHLEVIEDVCCDVIC